jgi:hypothetical protein
MSERSGQYKKNDGTPFSQNPSEIEKATKIVIEALGGFHWRGDYFKFCEVLGFEPSEYAEEKYSQFQELISNLNNFDLESITKIVQEGIGTGKK